MADDIKLPAPDSTLLSLIPPWIRRYYTPKTVRRLIAEHVAAAVAAEREDTRRLDWLLAPGVDSTAIRRRDDRIAVERWIGDDGYLGLGDTLRAAIDAAMQAERGEAKP